MSENLVVIEQMSKSFSKEAPPALVSLSAVIPAGKIVGLAGPDGSGKTTLIRLIAGLLIPSSGKITVSGFDSVSQAHEIHCLLGYMPQRFGLYEDLTVEQNLNLYADIQGVVGKEREAVFERLLTFTSLKPFLSRLAKDLSGGMKQKLGLACTLIKKPKLLLLDEPSVGVDPLSRRELWKMVHDLVDEGISVLWSTAYLDEAERCDQVLLLNEGKLIFSGTPADLLRQEKGMRSFEEAFIQILGGVPEAYSLLAEKMPLIKAKNNPVIVAKGLTKTFGTFTAARDITFEVNKGEIFGLLGPNGAGKSTTFKMLCGLLTPTQGQAFVSGYDLQKAPSQARSQIGYMAQKFSLYGNLSVTQNLDFFAGIYNLSRKEAREMTDEMVEIFNLRNYLDTNAEALPLGYKQRLALSCSLMHRPPVLFLDEPTSGVDPLTRREFWMHIKGLVDKGVTVMVTTHFMEEAENCDRIALVYKSQIITMGTPTELKKKAETIENLHPTLEDAFINHIINYDREHN